VKGIERLSAVNTSTPRMARALPDMPMPPTVMIRLLRISAFGLSTYFDPVLRDIGTSEHEFHVLCLLSADQKGTAAPSELSELVGTSRANMTRILDQLLRDDLVTRTVQARDGRRFDIRITAAGRKRVREIVPRMIEPLNRAFSVLSDEEFALLDTLLRKVIVSLDQSARDMSAAA
jgi:MarR family transcriptional regulator, negative regulator of the multidrug operon emrRAB